MKAHLKNFINVTRLNKPIGFLLLFWPCSWGLSLALYFNGDLDIFLYYIPKDVTNSFSFGESFHGVLLFVILSSCIIMTWSLIKEKKKLKQIFLKLKKKKQIVKKGI